MESDILLLGKKDKETSIVVEICVEAVSNYSRAGRYIRIP